MIPPAADPDLIAGVVELAVHTTDEIPTGRVPADTDPTGRDRVAPGTDVRPLPRPTVMADRRDGLVVRLGDLVIKVHDPAVDRDLLALRMGIAALPELREIFVPQVTIPLPAREAFVTRSGRDAVSAWEAGVPLAPEELDDAPWEEGAALLAHLHDIPLAVLLRVHLPGPLRGRRALPSVGAPDRVRRSLERLRRALGDHPDATLVARAFSTLPAWAVGTAPEPPGTRVALTHGDWHLGQLVRHRERWRLIDVDDLGVGDPSWDLARPAAWFAAGVLDPEVWERFLHRYTQEGGTALPDPQDPWSTLDVPARAMAVQTAAVALAHAREHDEPLDDVAVAFLDSCRRIAAY